MKYPIGNEKSIVAVNLPLKLLCTTVANADIASLKSLHIFILYVFGPHAGEIGTTSFEIYKTFSLLTKTAVFKPF